MIADITILITIKDMLFVQRQNSRILINRKNTKLDFFAKMHEKEIFSIQMIIPFLRVIAEYTTARTIVPHRGSPIARC